MQFLPEKPDSILDLKTMVLLNIYGVGEIACIARLTYNAIFA